MASAEQVQVEVEDGLSGAGADVEDGAIAALDAALASDAGGGELALADQFSIFGLRFLQSGEVALGDDEDVRRGLRVDVLEGEGVLVLVNLLGGDLAGDDLAEEAIHKNAGARD